MSSINAKVDARRMLARFKALPARLQRPVIAEVAALANMAEVEVRAKYSKPVGRRGQRVVKRSRPGQPGRMDVGTMRAGVSQRMKTPLIRYVTVDAEAVSDGARYPWMLESGTRKMKKRPAIKPVQRKMSRLVSRRITAAIKRALKE